MGKLLYGLPVEDAILGRDMGDGRVRCDVCPRYCVLKPGMVGACGTRVNLDGQLKTLIYGQVSSAAADPIEKKPVFHYMPGSYVFSVGSLGCNMHCAHCQNWMISFADRVQDASRDAVHVPPWKLVELAKRFGCQGVAWTYNEPTIWLEYTIDSAKLAKEAGLYTVYVTAGYITPEALDAIAPHLDVYRVDIKGWTEEFYKRLARVPEPQWVLDAAVRARVKWGLHVECVTNVIPTYNDDEYQLREIARWIYKELGPDTPWHVTGFWPHHELAHLPPTPVATLERGVEIGREEGLRYVYIGNVPGHPWENTYCPACGQLLIERRGFGLGRVSLGEGNRCPGCGLAIPISGTVSSSTGRRILVR
jgi:pyruvate formate lyase activating enzyme